MAMILVGVIMLVLIGRKLSFVSTADAGLDIPVINCRVSDLRFNL